MIETRSRRLRRNHPSLAFRPPAGETSALESRQLLTVAIDVRYDFDTSGFFNSQARRDVMQQAANSLAGQLGDLLAEIRASGSNTWSAAFANPSNGAQVNLTNLVVPQNTLVVYVGARALSGSERGLGGPGGYSWSGDASWGDLVEGRGQAGAILPSPTDYATWGGTITFDTRANWFFGATTSGLTGSQTDFLSVAEHEIGHVLGIGDLPFGVGATAWSRLSAAGRFLGPASEAAFGGAPVPLDASGAHWAGGIASAGQEPAMSPVLIDGTRKLFTPLDFAGLSDIGWLVQSASQIQFATSASSITESGGTAPITITRSNPTGVSSVVFATSGGTARAGVDYAPFSLNLVFGPGEASKTIYLVIQDDRVHEANETVTLSLSSFSGAAPGQRAQSTVTILDNDPARNGLSDFDGDGRTDLSVFRPTEARWIASLSAGGSFSTVLGVSNFVDIPAPGDYDGDGKTDLIVFRPSQARWVGHLSGGGTMDVQFGDLNLNDIPVPGDFDRDGKTDLAIFRPSQGRWLARLSAGGFMNEQFGDVNLSDIPAVGDYDGDGKSDLAVYRPSQDRWLSRLSSGGFMNVQFGEPNLSDIPAPGDYDGDGKTDLAVFRPSQSRWLARLSGGGFLNTVFGAPSLAELPTTSSVGSLMRLGIVGPAPTASIRSSAPTATVSVSPAPVASHQRAPAWRRVHETRHLMRPRVHAATVANSGRLT